MMYSIEAIIKDSLILGTWKFEGRVLRFYEPISGESYDLLETLYLLRRDDYPPASEASTRRYYVLQSCQEPAMLLALARKFEGAPFTQDDPIAIFSGYIDMIHLIFGDEVSEEVFINISEC